MAEAICREIIRRRRRKKGKRAGDDGKGKERKTGANCAHILNRCHLYWNTQRECGAERTTKKDGELRT